MGNTNIYVAGPVARLGSSNYWNLDLDDLYDRIELASSEARVKVLLPRLETTLERFSPQAFDQVITERIQTADAMLLLALDPRTHAASSANYSIGCEAQKAAQAGLTIAVVAESPQLVPRLLLAL